MPNPHEVNGWIEFGKLAGAVATGAILVWLREFAAEGIERRRKQKALWLACAVEARAAENDFAQIKWMMDMVGKGNAPVSVAYVNAAGSRLAERLVELDGRNVEAYLSFILRTAQMAQKSEDLRKELVAHAALSDADRVPRIGLVHSELIHTARTMVRQIAARLDVLRGLKARAARKRAREVISSTERDLTSIGDEVDQWESTYAALVGIGPELDALRKVRPPR